MNEEERREAIQAYREQMKEYRRHEEEEKAEIEQRASRRIDGTLKSTELMRLAIERRSAARKNPEKEEPSWQISHLEEDLEGAYRAYDRLQETVAALYHENAALSYRLQKLGQQGLRQSAENDHLVVQSYASSEVALYEHQKSRRGARTTNTMQAAGAVRHREKWLAVYRQHRLSLSRAHSIRATRHEMDLAGEGRSQAWAYQHLTD